MRRRPSRWWPTLWPERPLDLLLNTHLHSDHCGGNAALQARHPGVRTLIPPGQAEPCGTGTPSH